MEAGNPLLDDYVLSLTGRERPRVCFVPTASGDADHYVVRFYRAFAAARLRAEPRLALPPRPRRAAVEGDLAAHLLAQDLIYVGGGSVVSLLGVWRAHGLDAVAGRGLAARHRAVRPERRLAVLVRRGGHRLPRRAHARARGWACCRTPTACTTTASRRAARSTAGFVGDGHVRRATRADDGAALHFVGNDLAPGRRLAARQARLPRRRRDDGTEVVEEPAARRPTSARRCRLRCAA